MKKTSNIILPLALAAALPLSAQNLKTEITVDRTIVPIERQATRIGGIMPQLLPADVKFRKLSLADYTKPSAITPSAATLSAANFGDTLTLSPYKGYASLGYFPAFNLGASAGYRFINNQRTTLGAWLQYDGCDYKTKAYDHGRYSNNTVAAGVDFAQRFGEASELSANLAYNFGAVKLPDAFAANKQNTNTLNAQLGWASRLSTFGYNASVRFNHFAYGKDAPIAATNQTELFKTASENRFTFAAGAAFFGSSPDTRGGIDLKADFVDRSNGFEVIPPDLSSVITAFTYRPIKVNTLGVISLTPYYALKADRFYGHLGAKIDLSVAGEGKKFHIAPDVMANWTMTPNFSIYALAQGGEVLNTLQSLNALCPWFGGLWQYGRSHVPVTADLGFVFGPAKGFSAKLFGGYASANNWLMPQLIDLAPTASPTTPQAVAQNATGVNYGEYNLRAWHCGLTLAYDWKETVNISFSGETANNGLDRSFYLWRDRARYVLGTSVKVKPMEKLLLGLDYSLRTGRHNYKTDGIDFTEVKLGNFSNLSFSASFAINPRLTVFATGENLLNRRDFIVADIEAQGIKGLVGAAYKF